MRQHLFDVAITIITTAAVAAGQTKFIRQDKTGGEGDQGSAAQEQYENRAYPNAGITIEQQQGAFAASQLLSRMPGGKKTNWQLIGPNIGVVPGAVTYTGRDTIVSGRVTALALSPTCSPIECKIFVGAAGGGIWEADNAFAPQLNWTPSGAGISSNAIGAIIFDPTDPSGRTLYAGTGEPNGSQDSEAGVGLFKSVDFGRTWSAVGTSFNVSASRAISSVVIDPTNGNHIYMGTAFALRGVTAVEGGEVLPPGPTPGLYESLDGGATWTRTLATEVAEIQLDLKDPATVYVACGAGFGSGPVGVFRRSNALDGDTLFHQVLAVGSFDRTDIAVTVKNGKTRIYAGYGGGSSAAQGILKRNDNADQPAAAVLASWITLSNSTKGNPGFASYHFCGQQCWFDIIVASPPGQPDTLWLGGQMQYDEIFSFRPPSNGRAVQRSTNAGVGFTDMTDDAQSPALGMHPDQHAIAFAPFNPDIAFIGSDGGVVRTSGSFVDASVGCDSRGLTSGDLTDCKMWLSAIPTQIDSLNRNLATLQFQSVSVNPFDPFNDVIGGTQDNGTWAYNGKGVGSWFESVGGDGGQSGINVGAPNIRAHTYTGPESDINFRGNDPLGWNWWADPLFLSGEPAAFYTPFIADPRVSGTWFIGMGRVWRTQDNGGSQTFLEEHCNEFTGDLFLSGACGDWKPLGASRLTSSVYGLTRTGRAVAAVVRAAGDSSTLWAATRTGRLFVSKNADLPNNAAVTFTRIDTPLTPGRFISGIAVDPGNSNHAFVSFSGYNTSTPATPGHVFEVTFNGSTATWKDLSYNLGDIPITAIALDSTTGDLFAGTDFGAVTLRSGGNTWTPAAGSLPPAAVSGLTINSAARVLYAATHGRGIWSLNLSN
jgi:hypothetical protein